jgi:hypothetical protein
VSRHMPRKRDNYVMSKSRKRDGRKLTDAEVEAADEWHWISITRRHFHQTATLSLRTTVMDTNSHQPVQRQDARALREERIWLMGRHDTGALAPQVYAIVRFLEVEISWLEYRRARS